MKNEYIEGHLRTFYECSETRQQQLKELYEKVNFICRQQEVHLQCVLDEFEIKLNETLISVKDCDDFGFEGFYQLGTFTDEDALGNLSKFYVSLIGHDGKYLKGDTSIITVEDFCGLLIHDKIIIENA